MFGVIFDMDGVLVDSGPAHLRSWQALALEYAGKTITPEQFGQTFGQRSAEIIHAWFGVSDPGEIARLDGRKEAIYRDLIRGRVPAMPGALDCVRRLHAAGLSLAVGSSGPPENVALVSEEMGLSAYLSAVVTGMDVTRGKPDPQVFELAAERLGLPDGDCVVIEDAPSGVEAARRAGMACILLSREGAAPTSSNADHVVRHLDEISADLVNALAAGNRLGR